MKADKMYVLVVSDNSESIGQLQRIFAVERDYYLQFSNQCKEALQIAGQANQEIDLILVDDAVQDASSLETVRKLAILLPSVPIMAIADQNAVSYVREALLAGARAFLTKPLHDSDVLNTISQILQMESVRRSQQSHAPEVRHSRCTILTVMSPKGGVGTTTLAVNLAVTLRSQTAADVVLIDGHGSLGDLVAAMNLQTQFSHADLLQHGAQLDPDIVDHVLAAHSSGVRVLASGEDLEDADYFTPEIFEAIVTLLRETTDFIVIDAGTIFEEQTAVALSVADHVLMVTTPEITSLRRCTLFLKAAEQGGFPREKIQLVVNRDGVSGGLSSEDISANLNMQVAAAIPDDSGFVTYSLNRGIPLVRSNPRSAVARRIEKLATRYVPDRHEKSQPAPRTLLGRLSTILRGSPA